MALVISAKVVSRTENTTEIKVLLHNDEGVNLLRNLTVLIGYAPKILCVRHWTKRFFERRDSNFALQDLSSSLPTWSLFLLITSLTQRRFQPLVHAPCYHVFSVTSSWFLDLLISNGPHLHSNTVMHCQVHVLEYIKQSSMFCLWYIKLKHPTLTIISYFLPVVPTAPTKFH